MELNLKLREDLTLSFENYIRVLNVTDRIQRENVELKFKVEKLERESQVDLHAFKSRCEILEKQVTDRDNRL